jgi:hypothetical protein
MAITSCLTFDQYNPDPRTDRKNGLRSFKY